MNGDQSTKTAGSHKL